MSNLKKSQNKILAGVCGGIAEKLDADPTIVRVVYAALSIFCFPFVLLYIVMCFVMPE